MRLVCIVVLGSVLTCISGTENVMNLHKNNSVRLRPRVLINRHVNERKQKDMDLIKTTDEPPKNAISKETRDKTEVVRGYESHLTFPHSLNIVTLVLEKLKNEKCVKETSYVLEAMARKERWALEMFDSFPKFPIGILFGNHYELGNFDECRDAKHFAEFDDGSTTMLRGQYCLADIHFRHRMNNKGRFARSSMLEERKDRYQLNNTVLHWGVCLPSSCTPEDAEIFVAEIFSSSVDSIDLTDVQIDDSKCYYDHAEPITNWEIIYGCLVGAFLMISLLSTALHFYFIKLRKKRVAYNVDAVRPKKNMLKEVVLCFSLIRTVGKLLHTKPNELNLECICGIRVISMVLIICGHTIIFVLGGPISNIGFFKQMTTRIENGMFVNNALLVDTFLFLSGFLMCRLLLIELEKRKGRINILTLYIARYIRLTPSYVVVIGLYTSWLKRLGSGPLWNSEMEKEQARCINSWWTNLLYVNNYVNTDQLCMFQSWYLAVDYHLFIIAPIIVYTLWKWRKCGKCILAICVILTIIVPFWITYQEKLDPTLFAYPSEVMDITLFSYFKDVYIKTHLRANSYMLGLVFGYLVHKLQSSGTKIKPWVIHIGWILAPAFGTISMCSVVIFYNPDHEYSSLESAIYAAFHRAAWCLSVGWVILVCVTDNAAYINKLLSWKLFIPLSRLTYCAYLTNGFVEIYNRGTMRQPSYLGIYEMICLCSAHIGLTFGLAFVLCIFFESPIHGMEKILLSIDKQKRAPNPSNVENSVR